MKTELTLTILLMNIAVCFNGQSGKLNQLDSVGKKTGKWIVYLNKDWNKVKDSTQAVFSRYTYFEHGTNIYPMGPCGGKNYKLEITGNDNQEGNKIKLLNGEYKWYDAKGHLSSVHILKNGEYVSCKEYYSSGELNQHFDYSKKCEGHTLGWCVFIYDKNGNLKMTSYMCKDKNGHWPPTRG